MEKKIKMPVKLKAKWVSELESGNYKQGSRGYLKKGNSYDPIGILVELCGDNPEGRSILDKSSPNALKKLKSKMNLSDFGKLQDKLLKLSTFSDKGKDFKYIATYVKRYL